MKLHSPAFEKALKRQCKAAIRKSSELKREYRRIKRHYRRQYGIFKIVRPFLSLLLGFMVFAVAEQSGHASPALALISVIAFLFATYRVPNLLERLYLAPELLALMLLPIPQQSVFRWEFLQFIRRSLWSLWDIFATLAGLALYFQFSPAQYLAVLLIAVAVWTMVIALATFGAAYFPGLPYRLAAGVAVMTLWVGLVSDTFRGQMMAFLKASAGVITMLLPTGWAVSLFHLLTSPADWLCLVLIAPIALVIGSLKFSIARLKSSYEFHEPIVPEAPDMLPGADEDAEHPAADAVPQVTGPGAIEEIILTRQFLAPVLWNKGGWLEKILWNWFTPRQRAVADFTFTNGIEISKAWKRIAISLLVTSLLSGAVSLFSAIIALWVLGLGLFFTFCQILQQLGGTSTFQTIHSSGVSMPLYSAYPVGFSELAHILLKRTIVQIPLLFASALAGSLIVAYVAHLPIMAALIFGIKAGGVLFAATFILVTFGFSGGTNDTYIRLRTLPFLTLMVTSGGAGLILALGAFLWTHELAGWVCWLLLIADAYAFFRIYGYFYNRNTFDLMRMPQQQM